MKKRRDWQTRFINALRVLGNVWVAAKQASIGRTQVYDEYDRNPEFARLWDAAEEESADRLEAEAWRRAHDGCDRPVFHQGEQCGVVREYSDTLLTLLLRARRPSKFRENYNLAIGNPDGSKLEIDGRQQAINLFTSSPEAAAHMIALANLMVPGEDDMAKLSTIGGQDTKDVADRIKQAEVLPDCAPGNLAHTPPIAQEAPPATPEPPKAKKRGRPKKTAPQAQEIEIDDTDAKPLEAKSGWMAFLPNKSIDKIEGKE